MQALHLLHGSAIAATLVGCDGRGSFDIALERSDVVPTVYTAHWNVDLGDIDEAWFELGRDGVVERILPVDPSGGGPWETFLYGMKPATEYELRAVVERDGERFESASYRVETGLPPAELPELALERATGADGFEGLLTTSVMTMPPAALMLDEDGDIVWWFLPADMESVGRAYLARDGRSVLLQSTNLWDDETYVLARVTLDGSGLEYLPTKNAHHDFVELPDGTITTLSYDPQHVDEILVPGDRLLERAPDGTTREVWNAWDDPQLEFSAAEAYMGRLWPHANALDYLEDEDAYVVGFLSLEAVARIDRATGTVDWWLGGERSDFTLPDGGTDLFSRQHQLQQLDDGVLVFDNGPLNMGFSSALEYALDYDAGTAEERWSHRSSEGFNSLIFGDVHRFEGGDTLITWSYAGAIQQVDPEGEPVWTLTATVGGAFGYTTWLSELPVQ